MYIYECFVRAWICAQEVYIFVCTHEGLRLSVFYHHPTYLLSCILSLKPSKSLTEKLWLVWLSSLLWDRTFDSYILSLQTGPCSPDFYSGAGKSKSSHSCIASSLPPESLIQPSHSFYKDTHKLLSCLTVNFNINHIVD